ncbi:MAG: two-component system NtrC family sensor kinase [Thermoproteota archaeon]|jgi:two-component system NtrC family sensor kinase
MDINSDFFYRNSKLLTLGLVTSGITHEINNPLSVVTGCVDMINLLIEKEEMNTEDLKKIIKSIEESSYEVADIIKNIRVFCSQRNDKFEFITVLDIFNELSVFYIKKFKNNNVNYNCDIDPGITVYCAEDDISIAILNFLYFALEWQIQSGTSDKEVNISAKIINNKTFINISFLGDELTTSVIEALYRADNEESDRHSIFVALSAKLVEKGKGKIDMGHKNKTNFITLELDSGFLD